MARKKKDGHESWPSSNLPVLFLIIQQGKTVSSGLRPPAFYTTILAEDCQGENDRNFLEKHNYHLPAYYSCHFHSA
jgi:hypothetical protein